MKDLFLDKDLDIKDLRFTQKDDSRTFDAERELTDQEWLELEVNFTGLAFSGERMEKQTQATELGFYFKLLSEKRFKDNLARNRNDIDSLLQHCIEPWYSGDVETSYRIEQFLRCARYKLIFEQEGRTVLENEGDYQEAYKHLRWPIRADNLAANHRLTLNTLFITGVIFPDKFQELRSAYPDGVKIIREQVLPRIRASMVHNAGDFAETAALARLCFGLTTFEQTIAYLGITANDWKDIQASLASLRRSRAFSVSTEAAYFARPAAYMQVLSASTTAFEESRIVLGESVDLSFGNDEEAVPSGRNY